MERNNLLKVMTALWLTAAIGFTSCTNTDTVETAEGPAPRTVTFNISLPNGDPVRYTRAQDATEYTLTSLRLLTYDAASDVLQSDASISPTYSTNDGNHQVYTWQKTFSDPAAKNPALRFAFIGNDAAAITASSLYSALADVKCSPTIAAGALSSVFTASQLPMSGVAVQTGGTEIISLGESTTANATVEMVRCVARIDVKNTVSNLIITELSLDNVVSQGYLMKRSTIAAAGSKVSGVLPFTPLTTLTDNQLVGSNDGVTLAKAFYVYEDVAGLESSILTLNVKGTVSGVPVYYSIPFKAKYTSAGSGETSIAIERNHLYTVQLGNGAPIAVNTSVQPTIVSAVWTAGDPVSKSFSSEIFTVTGGTSYETTTQNIHIDAAAVSSGLTIDVSDDYYLSGSGVNIASVEVNDGSGWCTAVTTTETAADANVASGGNWLTATFTSAKTVTITAGANAGAQRIGQIRIRYKDTPSAGSSTPTVFTVTQAANS